MNTITDRIIIRAKQLNLRQLDIMNATQAKRATVNKWFNNVSEPSAKYYEDLSNVLKVSIQWLITGYDIENSNVLEGKIKIRKAPIFSLYEIAEIQKLLPITDEKREFEYFVDKNFGEDLYWIRMKSDNSMIPIFSHGELVLVDSQREPRTGNYVVAVIAGDNRATLRNFRTCFDEKANKEYYQLVAQNDFYPPIDSRRDKFQVKGVAVKHERILI